MALVSIYVLHILGVILLWTYAFADLKAPGGDLEFSDPKSTICKETGAETLVSNHFHKKRDLWISHGLASQPICARTPPRAPSVSQ